MELKRGEPQSEDGNLQCSGAASVDLWGSILGANTNGRKRLDAFEMGTLRSIV